MACEVPGNASQGVGGAARSPLSKARFASATLPPVTCEFRSSSVFAPTSGLRVARTSKKKSAAPARPPLAKLHFLQRRRGRISIGFGLCFPHLRPPTIIESCCSIQETFDAMAAESGNRARRKSDPLVQLLVRQHFTELEEKKHLAELEENQ